jgi:hypothetical protein
VGVKWWALDCAFCNFVLPPSNLVAGKGRSALRRDVRAGHAKN